MKAHLIRKNGTIWLAVILFFKAGAISAADVTITVNGQVRAQPCTITTPDADVELGVMTVSSMSTANATSEWKEINLNLTQCPVGTSQVTATFSGTSDGTGNYFLNAGDAGNIAVQLADSNGNNLKNGAALIRTVDDTSRSTQFALQARAISPSGGATRGTISSIINVTYTWQ